jgi:hypothetical protein
MATTENSGMNDGGSHPGYYDNAQDYVLDHLDPHEPQSPAELAEEYGCVGDHMRKTLAELADSGEVERASRGQYVLPDGDTSTPPGEDMGTADEDSTVPDPETASTADLYQQQHTQDDADEEREISEDDAESEPEIVDVEDSDSGGVEDAAPAAVLPMDPMTLGMILAVALGVWLVYRNLGGDSGSEQGPDAGGDQGDDGADVSGGLLG